MMQIQYLEIVATDVDQECAVYSAALGVEFSDPVPELGNARTAPLSSGARVGIRAPMHELEQPTVRPYWLVEDIEASVAGAEAAGATIIHPPLLIEGQGTFAIYEQHQIQQGLWQL